VPSNATLSAAELGLVSSMNRESMLAGLLKSVESKYDYILIDCLPSLGLLAINALRAANGIVIPVQADFLAMQGLAQIFETIAAVREQLNPDLNIYGVLLTLVDQRTAHSRDVVKVVRSSLDGQVNVFATEVRLHVALKECAKSGRSILDFDTNSPSAATYRRLGVEVLAACGDVAVEQLPVEQTTPNLLDLPVLVAKEPDREEVVVVRQPRAEAPSFESFVLEGWQRWLGASR
jgi:chromosome partitioning protein